MSDNNIKNRFQCCDIGPGLLAEMKAAAESDKTMKTPNDGPSSKSNPVKSGLLSKPLMIETLKNTWYLPVLSFVVYFLSGIFPIIIDISSQRNAALGDQPLILRHLDLWLNNANAGFSILMTLVPLIAAIIVMNYLHRPARTMAIHAYPFTRTKIFLSQVISGWLMCIVPVLMTGICFLPFAPYASDGASAVFYWFCSSASIITYFYGIFVLAGSLTGNSVMQLLVSGIFFTIVPAVLWITGVYCESFLYGFTTMPELMVDFMSKANPFLSTMLFGSVDIDTSTNMVYAIGGIIFILVAHYAVKHAKLEKSGDSMYYKIVEEFITWLVVFIGMTVCGILFSGMWDTTAMLLAGVTIGTLLTFIVSKIIISRSIKIFSKSNLISLLGFTLLTAVFLSVTVFDITGFAKRVPEKEDVVSVSGDIIFGYDNYSYNGPLSADEYSMDFTEEESIENILALHQYVVDYNLYKAFSDPELHALFKTETEIYDDGIPVVSGNEYIRFTYTLTNGRTMERSFDVPLTADVGRLINEIVTSKEYLDHHNPKRFLSAQDTDYALLSFIHYSSKWDGEEEDHELHLMINDTQQLEQLIEALTEDHYAKTYLVSEEVPVYDLNPLSMSCEFYFPPEDQSEAALESSLNNTIHVSLNPQQKETLTLIKSLFLQENTAESLYFAEYLEEIGF